MRKAYIENTDEFLIFDCDRQLIGSRDSRMVEITKKELGDFIDEYNKLEAENKRLREALEFYANENDYEDEPVPFGGGADNDGDGSKIFVDLGQTARQVLKGK